MIAQITADFKQNGLVILPDAFSEFSFSDAKLETIHGQRRLKL
jgi:hypothetical protein